MSNSKKGDISFYIILALIIILSVAGTIYAIKRHNNVDKSPVINTPKEEEEVLPYLTFKEVPSSSTVDIFKKYPINSLKINYSNDTVSISGLKDKEVETKINKKLATLDAKKNEYDNRNCYVNFNMSNVLSISCKEETINVNLIDGEDLKIEEIFNKDTDISSIILKGIYDTYCSWNGCTYNEEYATEDYYNEIDEDIVEKMQNIKNNNYKIKLYENSLNILYPQESDTYDNLDTSIQFSDFIDSITIYDRFLKDDIYETKVTDYCTPNSCYYKINKNEEDDVYYIKEFLNSKTFLNYRIYNSTRIDILSNDKLSENVELNLEEFNKKIKDEIIKKENLNTKGNNYTNLDIYVDIYYHTSKDYQILYSITSQEFTKEDFAKNRLESMYTNYNCIKEKRIDKINMLVDTNNNVTYLDNNPANKYRLFETRLYNHILKSLEDEANDAFTYYNDCDIADNYEECISKRDYHDLIKEASYAIDEEKNILYMYEEKPGIGMAESYVNAGVSLDIFKEETSNNFDESQNENTDLN